MVTATTVELYDGLVAHPLPGQGWLASEPDPARYDAVWAHCEVLVVGAGPAGGRRGGRGRERDGQRVILVDERPPDRPVVPNGRATTLSRTTVVGYYDDNFLVAVERRTNHLGSAAPPDQPRERLWRIRAGRVVLATGAHERLIPFPDNDRPGVMLAGAALTYLQRVRRSGRATGVGLHHQ